MPRVGAVLIRLVVLVVVAANLGVDVAGGASTGSAASLPIDDDARLAEVEVRLAQALDAFESEAWTDALQEIDAAAAILHDMHGGAPHLDLVGCHGMSARVHLAMGDRERAVERLQRGTAMLLELTNGEPDSDAATGLVAGLLLMIELAEDLDADRALVDLCIALDATRSTAQIPLDDHTARLLERAVSILRDLDRHAAAIPLLESLAARDDSRRERLMHLLADVHRTLGDPDAQIEWLRKVVETRRSQRPPQLAAIASAEVDVGDALMAAGRPHDALASYELALELRSTPTRPGEAVADAWALAEMINNVAVATVAVGRPLAALPRYEEALAMRRRLARGEANRFVAVSLDNLAACLNRIGRHREAVDRGEEALAMLIEIVGDADDFDVATTLNNLAAAQNASGRIELALPLQERAAAMRLRLDGDAPSPEGILSSVNLALALHSVGRSGEAAVRVDEALVLLEELPTVSRLSVHSAALQVAAVLHAAFGRGDEAVAALRGAIALSHDHLGDDDHPEVAGLLVDLAALLGELGRPDEALVHGERALGMLTRRLGADHPDRATALMILATQEVALGDPRVARRHLKEALEIFERAFVGFDVDHPLVVECLDRLAFVVNELGDVDHAIALSHRAAESAYRAGMQSAVRVTANYGWLLVDVDQTDAAATWFERSIELQEKHLGVIGGTELERSAVSGSLNMFGAGVGLAWIDALRGDPESAIAHLERSRSRTLREMLERGRRSSRHGILGAVLDVATRHGDEALRVETIELADALAAAATLVADATEATRGAALQRYAALRRAALALLDRHVPSGIEPIAVADIQAALGTDDVVLLYLISPHAGVVFAIGHPDGILARNGESALRQHGLVWPEGGLVTAAGLRHAIGRHLSGLMIEGRLTRGIGRERPIAGHGFASGSHRLFQALVPPDLWEEIAGARIAHVVPDASMHRLPFESLPIEPPTSESADGRRHWIDGGPMLTYSPSATVLVDRIEAATLQNAAPSRASIELFAVGDPIFAGADRLGAPDLAPLPGTRDEVVAIVTTIAPESTEALLASSTVPFRNDRVIALLGESASRASLEQLILRDAITPRRLHLATHGIVESGGHALESRLALSASPESSGASAALTLRDLLDGWGGVLARTELVVLSACDSVGGDGAGQNLRDGEGIFGLPWGFMYAGAPTVIASLWEVDDASTALLMEHFYRELHRADRDPRQDAGDARVLRAFTAARRQLRLTHPEPFHWAPFILMGSPGR